MTHVPTSEDKHAIDQMIAMYDTVCTNLRTLKDDARIASVYALYDCVSLVLARMLKPYPGMVIKSHNAKRLHESTVAIDEDDLNRMFIDFDREYYGKTMLTVAMDAVNYDDCQKNLFWRRTKEDLEIKSSNTHVKSEKSFDPEAYVQSEKSFDSDVNGESSSEGEFDPESGVFARV